jgi:precorrin-2/cobalt-factor-2 C20-methyltransferase
MGCEQAMTGTLSLVGVGPGDPELITLKAARIIAAANVVAYPSTGEESALAFDIARGHVNSGAQLRPVPIPLSVERAPAESAYNAAAATLLGHVEFGRNVVWLCEGDPLFYGSAMYLLTRLAHKVPVLVVPGVTSLTAASGVIGRPLAARNETLKVLPAPLPDETLRAELETAPAAAIIKVGRHFDRIRALLAATGHATNAIVVEHATTARQRITPLADFAHDERPYFSTILCYRGEEAWR